MLANLGNLYLKCLQKGISMINKDCLSRTIERCRNQKPRCHWRWERGRRAKNSRIDWNEPKSRSCSFSVSSQAISPHLHLPGDVIRRCYLEDETNMRGSRIETTSYGGGLGSGILLTSGQWVKGHMLNPKTSFTTQPHWLHSSKEAGSHAVTLGQETGVWQREGCVQSCRVWDKAAIGQVRRAESYEHREMCRAKIRNLNLSSKLEGVAEGSKTYPGMITSAFYQDHSGSSEGSKWLRR